MRNFIKVVATTAAVAALTSTAMAQITYVDATDGAAGNTAIAPSAGGGTFTAFVGQTGVADDGVWDLRAFGNSATIFQNAGTTEQFDVNAPRLETSVTGLALDTYNVYAYFWTDSSLNWRVGASLSDSVGQLSLFLPGGANTTQYYTGADATVLSSSLSVNPFTSDVMIAEGNRRLNQAYLGQVTGTDISVFIEGDRTMTTQDQRTWYEGIGYSVVPEPSSMALLGLGALLATFAVRRRMS